MMKSDFLLFFLIRWKAWHYILHISYIEYLQITIIDEIVLTQNMFCNKNNIWEILHKLPVHVLSCRITNDLQ